MHDTTYFRPYTEQNCWVHEIEQKENDKTNYCCCKLFSLRVKSPDHASMTLTPFSLSQNALPVEWPPLFARCRGMWHLASRGFSPTQHQNSQSTRPAAPPVVRSCLRHRLQLLHKRLDFLEPSFHRSTIGDQPGADVTNRFTRL